ncbi:MAG: hypothetical protein ACFCU2_12125 [Acidimicrobiia bacterium]
MSTNNENRAAQGRKPWLLDVVVGGISGGLVGAVVAVNLVIYSGMERGYETTIPEVFRESVLIGLLVVAILLAGPVAGVWIARRLRRQRTSGRVHG